MRARLALAAWVFGLCGLPAAGQARFSEGVDVAADAPRNVDYLMIRGNEGGSAGGHAAIRFGAETFHFEHADGLLRLGRDDSERFQYVYRTLQNRDIELSRVPVAPETYALLHDAFERRALVQERQLEIEAETRADANLFRALRARERGASGDAAGFEVRGAGFFAAASDPTAPTAPDANQLAALRLRIEALHGREFLARRRNEVDQTIASQTPQVVPVDEVDLSADRYPVVEPSYSRSVESWLAARLALELLASPRPLRPEALAPAAEELALSPAECERLRAAAAALRENMAQLVASQRDDWGFPLLLGMARLAAFETSLRSGRWRVLDPFPAASETLDVSDVHRALLPALLGEARADFERARQDFVQSRGFQEIPWNALETAEGRWLELRGVAAGAATIRIHAGTLIPEARAHVAELPRPSGDLGPLVDRSQAAVRRYRERLLALHGYDLVRHNCVSEIFRTLDAALGSEQAPGAPAALRALVRAESTRRLGGYVDPVAGFNFIPFVSLHRVRGSWSVAQAVSLPSYRRFRLAEMAASEPPLRVALRESNAFTARTHCAGDREGFFVFFTDTQVPLRPLLGAVNVGAGLLRSAVGLVALPFDGGRGLHSGLSGVLFSLPELVFQNIRKGYNDYVPPGERPPPG